MTRAVGVILILLGVLAFVLQGISYTTDEKVLDVGPIEVTAEKQKTIPIPPVLGGIALVGGIVLVALGRRKSGSR
jgi:Na+-transporting methylmalonyl-CoA/oxaloacetate decarboxylase gamma subunit